MRSYDDLDPDPETDGCGSLCGGVMLLLGVLFVFLCLSSCGTAPPHDITVTTTPPGGAKVVVHVQIQQPKPSMLGQILSGVGSALGTLLPLLAL